MSDRIEDKLAKALSKSLEAIYGKVISPSELQIQPTRKDFSGELTLVTFPLAKIVNDAPPKVAEALGEAMLKEESELIQGYEVVQGFLNFSLNAQVWASFLAAALSTATYGHAKPGSKGLVLVEYSSPNTNKPLHLGHLRNNFLGYAVSEILKAVGHTVKKVQVINDRGIHICKSMVAWQHFGNGETPENTGTKGDHLVGKYYVAFDKAYKLQVAELMAQGHSKEEAEEQAPIMVEARDMLLKWEANDAAAVALWKQMNGWVYEGFDATYRRMGVDFDKLYYESNTWLLGKEVALDGLSKGIFYRKADGSVWADLEDEGMDEKLLLRRDGTAVYMTQDLGTAIQRYEDFPGLSSMVYTVGNEQEYHFKVLFALLKKLGHEWAAQCYHLSYGMVELPQGKMKSREGTVVDADDLMAEMHEAARVLTEQLGKIEHLEPEGRNALYEQIGMAALKYFLLKVDPRKGMLFNPDESVDFNGHTGPFIQYGYARTRALQRKYDQSVSTDALPAEPGVLERKLLLRLYLYEKNLEEAASTYNPSTLANYLFELVKDFNTFYQQVPILQSDTSVERDFRMQLTKLAGSVVKSGMALLGIAVPEQM